MVPTPINTDTLFTYVSPPLRNILPALLKPSQNQIAEILLKTIGLERGGMGTADSARKIVAQQLLAWGAQRAAEGGLKESGDLGPVDGFGLRELEAGCAEVGLAVVGEASASNGAGQRAGAAARTG